MYNYVPKKFVPINICKFNRKYVQTPCTVLTLKCFAEPYVISDVVINK